MIDGRSEIEENMIPWDETLSNDTPTLPTQIKGHCSVSGFKNRAVESGTRKHGDGCLLLSAHYHCLMEMDTDADHSNGCFYVIQQRSCVEKRVENRVQPI
jgi:hypothetical protein